MLITANLVDLKVPQIWAKAVSQSHGKILARVGANHVIYPEREAGERVAHLVSGRMLDFIRFDDDFAIAKMYPPKFIRGVGLNESGVRIEVQRHRRRRQEPRKAVPLRRGEHGRDQPRPDHRVGHQQRHRAVRRPRPVSRDGSVRAAR